jgi:NADP-dependent 3-hydroxy acid dehydrogenase YdfG
VLDQHLGAGRDMQLERLTVRAVPERTLTVAATFGLEVSAAPEALKIAQGIIADEHDLATPTAVPAVGAALGDVSLAAKAQAAIAAAAGLNEDPCTILHPVRMADPVFLITGASSGIGAATARHASGEGYRLVLGARSEARLAELAHQLGGDQRALALRCDVTDWDQQQALVRLALERFGRLDVAFANAGFGARRGFLEESPEHWRSMVLTNVYGTALTIRAALTALKESHGHLLLTGSVAGRRALPGSLYSATKWAVTAMGESARQELSDTGVRVTVIEPGMVDTPFFSSGAAEWALKPDDVARAVMFAVSQPPHVDVNEILVRPTAQPS